MMPESGGESLILPSRGADSLLLANRGSVSSMSSGAEAVMRSIGAGVASLSVEESKSDHSQTAQPPKSKKQRRLSASSAAVMKTDVRRVVANRIYIIQILSHFIVCN